MNLRKIKGFLQDNNLLVADIVAAGGMQERWSKFEPYITKILFEPNEEEFTKLTKAKSLNSIIVNRALSDSEKTINFYSSEKK